MDMDAPSSPTNAPFFLDSEDDISNNSVILDPPKPDAETAKEPSKIKLLELPVEVLANIALHMSKRELVNFGSLCKQARNIASRYLFACISLGKLDSTKMQTCFETLNQDQLSLIRKFNVSFQLPLLATDKTEDRIRTKWLSVLLDLVGRNLKNLDIHIDLGRSTPGTNALTQPALESLSMLANAAERYSLVLDFTRLKDGGRDTSRFWTIFAHPALSSLSSKDAQSLKLVNFDSHFGKAGHDGFEAGEGAYDFTSPTAIEKNLLDKLRAMTNLTSQKLTACTFSTHFCTPYPFKLVKLELDFEGSRACVHNANKNLALSLIRGNRETLQELIIKGWSFTEDDTNGGIDMPSLRVLSIDLLDAGCSDLPTKFLHSPTLLSLSLKRACLHSEVYNTLTNTLTKFPSLNHLQIENCNLFEEDRDVIEQFSGQCETQDIMLRLVWPRGSGKPDIVYHYESDGEFYHLSHLEKCVQKIAFRLVPGDLDDDLSYEMISLQHIRFSFTYAPLDITKKDVSDHGLPTDNLVPFLKSIVSPRLEVLEVNISSPFIDYIQTLARYIGSGSFSDNFPMCKEIRGTITGDTHNIWEGDPNYRQYNHHKTASHWLKEAFIKACKEYHIDITGLVWTNARLVT